MLFIVGLLMGIERSVSLWSAFRASQSHSFPLARLAGNGVSWFLNLYCLVGFCLLLLMFLHMGIGFGSEAEMWGQAVWLLHFFAQDLSPVVAYL